MTILVVRKLAVLLRHFERGGEFFCALLLGLFCMQTANAHEVVDPTRSDFVAPAPGSYKLNKIMQAPEGVVLDVDDRTKPLSTFTKGKVTLLGFVYTTCTDAKGCPLAYKVFYDLKQAIENTPSMQDKIRFVSLSFDPQHDTPDIMRLYGGSYLRSGKGLQWYFLTTPSYKQLRPLLDGFGQDVSVEVNPKDKSVRAFSHVLKIFLIDELGAVREIYTTSYLIPEVVLNDMKTLLMEKDK